ncbi:hypothetical protein HNV08_00040 [Winogradskyella eckloniae]|uniref:hypothetical protein n=1 Tax=Winogradskyella eckloniae TaxID=1089306 RepID=UPI0015666283|nr:hypothetical protein [Winogradskyella eckloniae]NRD18419.1 hypothetical protein [Winogradskyella eckloniae]
MKISYVVVMLISFMIISCGDEKKITTEEVIIENDNLNNKITAKTIESIDYKDYALSPEAELEVSSWAPYQELSKQIEFLKKGDFSFFNDEIEPLQKFIDGFKASLPNTFNTNPILSRNVIIETSLLKLNEYLTLDNISRKDKLLGIKDVFVAFSNLNYQLNKKLERDMYNDIQPE